MGRIGVAIRGTCSIREKIMTEVLDECIDQE